jgi:hypothetical protein
MSCDMVPAYRYHRRVLQLLQWRCPPDRWWLKTPAHMHAIEALHAVYPDARFVMTHRDVATVLPSVCAVMDALSNVLAEHPDPVAMGRHNTEVWAESLRRLIAFRDDGHEDAFFDVAFADMQADPLGAVERLYEQLGDDLSPDARDRMAEWWSTSSTDRRAPSYHAEDFGLDPAELRRRFAFYHERFGIVPDDRPASAAPGPDEED